MMTIYNSIMHNSSYCWSIGTCITVGATLTNIEEDLDSPLGNTPGRPSKDDGDGELSLECTDG